MLEKSKLEKFEEKLSDYALAPQPATVFVFKNFSVCSVSIHDVSS